MKAPGTLAIIGGLPFARSGSCWRVGRWLTAEERVLRRYSRDV